MLGLVASKTLAGRQLHLAPVTEAKASQMQRTTWIEDLSTSLGQRLFAGSTEVCSQPRALEPLLPRSCFRACASNEQDVGVVRLDARSSHHFSCARRVTLVSWLKFFCLRATRSSESAPGFSCCCFSACRTVAEHIFLLLAAGSSLKQWQLGSAAANASSTRASTAGRLARCGAVSAAAAVSPRAMTRSSGPTQFSGLSHADDVRKLALPRNSGRVQ